MGIVIRLAPERTRVGDTRQYRVVLANGCVIGMVEVIGDGRFAARVSWGHTVPGWLALGDTGNFVSVADAAAAVWLTWMGSPPELGPTEPEFFTH
jgi:hypothetical protein